MKGIRKTPAFALVFILLLGGIGCSSDETPSGLSNESQSEVVFGEVKTIDDQVPVDGGVTIDIRLDTGAAERLLFGSLFTYPPPSQKRLELYKVIVELEVGDRVRASGTRTKDGIELEELAIIGQ